MARYEKAGRLQDTWRSLTAQQRAYFEACEAGLEQVVLSGNGFSPRLGA